MRSRIVAILLCVLLFFSAVYFVGFPEPEVPSAVDATTTTVATTVSDMAVVTPSDVTTSIATTVNPSVSDLTTESTTGTVTTTTEPTTKSETVICTFKDISYGNDSEQTLDLTLPVDNREETGLILFLHGGGWVGGDKSSLKGAFSALSKNTDYAVATVNYRFATLGETDVYNIIDDITAALDHIKNLAAGYGVNIDKTVICGHSAGGHLALLYSYRFYDISPIKPVGVIATSPATDLSLDAFYTDNGLGDEKYMCDLMSNVIGVQFTPRTRAAHKELLRQVSPAAYVTKDSVPTIIVHGRKDAVVPLQGSEKLVEILNQNNVENEFVIFENSGHKLKDDKDTKALTNILMEQKIDSWFKSN